MKPQLTKEESDLYLKIVQYGNMDDMFDFGYVVGRERVASESMRIIDRLTNSDETSEDKLQADAFVETK